MKQYTRDQFIRRCRQLLTDLELDHEERTGIPGDKAYPFYLWVKELGAAEDNA